MINKENLDVRAEEIKPKTRTEVSKDKMYDLVLKRLRESHESRNNDRHLDFTCLRALGYDITFTADMKMIFKCTLEELWSMPSSETFRRSRQLIQHSGLYPPTRLDIIKARKTNEKEMHDWCITNKNKDMWDLIKRHDYSANTIFDFEK